MPTLDDINKIISAKTKIAVIGDLIIDEYWHGTVDRISQEAPVMILNQTRVDLVMGGAGNVYQNLKSLGADVTLFCNYPEGVPGIWTEKDAVYFNPYPCSRKVRMVVGNNQLLRVDIEAPYDQIEWQQFNSFSWWRELTDTFEWYDLIVIADYSKGVMSDGVINTILELAQITGKPVLVDAKRDLQRYNSEHVILKCNRSEWNAGKFEITGMKGLVVTEGAKGITVIHKRIVETFRGCHVDIVDVCGAGDTVTAVLAVGVASGMYLFNAANVANYAAAEVCRHPGVVPITPEGIALSYERSIL
jgi:D-beta-D-heptose 7-phosphate kinase/D-beta-D-heptose 1-phosphate adenosyltransferase